MDEQIMTVATDKHTYSFEEYLELEETSNYKHEYQDGEVVPMTGGTTEHNKIALNFAAYLKFALKGQKYNIFIGNVKLWIPHYRQGTYPDVMMIDGEPIYYESGKTTVTNPSFVYSQVNPWSVSETGSTIAKLAVHTPPRLSSTIYTKVNAITLGLRRLFIVVHAHNTLLYH